VACKINLHTIDKIDNKTTKPTFDLTFFGIEVVESYNDSIPKIVYFYKIDEKGNTTREKIKETHYYQNKKVFIIGGIKDEKRDGKWYAFFPDGTVQTEAFYVDGKEHGNYSVYQENGNPKYKGHFNHGECDGNWYFFDYSGNLTKTMEANKNTIVCSHCEKCLQLKQKKE